MKCGGSQCCRYIATNFVSSIERSFGGTGGLRCFATAFNYKGFMSKNKFPLASMFDSVVFSKVRELTGGRLRFTMNGASGISDSTKHFLSLVLAPMLTGYGLTETCANGSLGSPLEYSATAIGPIPAAIEVKLVAIPDMGYLTEAAVPQGEIYLKGLPIMKGYWKNPEETEKALTPDGWFKTGDIGEFDYNGHLKVIDRVKNLVKMQGGEYIALEKLESVYRGAPTVANVMIHADPEHTRPIAVVMTNDRILVDKAKELGVDEHDMHTSRKIKDLIFKDLQATGRRAGLSSLETIGGVVVTDVEWLPPTVCPFLLLSENVIIANVEFPQGLVTATQKLNRKVLREHFKDQITECLKTAP